MRTVVIDCAGVRTESDFWQRYVDAVSPAGADLFGRNLDALWDAIEAEGPGYPGQVVLHFTDIAALRRPANARFITSLQKLADESGGRVVLS